MCGLSRYDGERKGHRKRARHSRPNPAYLAGQLRDYRDGRRTNDILKEMRFFVQKLTDDEINALAVYYASQAGRPGSKP